MSRPIRTRTGSGTLLELVRGGYGALQLAAPTLVAEHVLNRPLDAPARAVARVLGARQLAQALASGNAPSYPVLALGVEVDLLHAGSMIALGIVDRRRGGIALVDALIAGSFALAGVRAAHVGAREPRPPRGAVDDLREAYAHRLARVFVPGYAAAPGPYPKPDRVDAGHPSCHPVPTS